MNYSRYPEYKPSGVEWLGEVPAHWTETRLKNATSVRVSNVDKKAVEGQEAVRLCNYVDVYYHDQITPDLEFMEATATTQQIEKFSLKKGDVLITKDSETPDDIAVPSLVASDLDGVVCGYHLALIRPDTSVVDGAYLARALAALGVRDQFHSAANGITRFGLSFGDISGVSVLVPPLNEQRAIAAFLDCETARIDALIARKQRLIELLAEKRTALISQAVTKGLNPDAPMKDSGVEWLGEIPAHWSVAALKREWVVLDCKHRTVPFIDDGLPVASVGEVLNFEIDLSNAKRTSREEYLEMIQGERKPRIGDIIYSRNATVGLAAYVHTDQEFCMGQDVCLIRSHEQNARFMVNFLRSPVVLEQLETLMVGATFRRVNVEQIKSLLVCYPPVSEQAEIANRCEYIRTSYQTLITRVSDAIARLQEFRAAMVSAAVTGKIDVRGLVEEREVA